MLRLSGSPFVRRLHNVLPHDRPASQWAAAGREKGLAAPRPAAGDRIHSTRRLRIVIYYHIVTRAAVSETSGAIHFAADLDFAEAMMHRGIASENSRRNGYAPG